MKLRNRILLAVSAAALALPAAASAQPYDGQRQYYRQPHGDWYQSRRTVFRGYPEFRAVETHILQEIQGGLRDDLLAREDADDFMGQLRQIQNRERQEYRTHGWNLPDFDRQDIRQALDQLDQLVDQTRDEP